MWALFLTSRVTSTVGSSRKVACVKLATTRMKNPTASDKDDILNFDLRSLLMARASTKTPRVRVSRQRGTKSSCGVEHEIRYTHDKEFLHLLQRFPPSLEGFTLTQKKKRSDAPYTKTEFVQTQESKDHMWMEGGNVYFTRALDSAQFLTENSTKMKKNPATEREKVARELDGKLKSFSLSKANPLLLLLLKRYAISHRNSLKLL